MKNASACSGRLAKALITFTMAGDPDIEATKRIIIEMEKNGSDIIEIGVPFSDPSAEGPVILAADTRALSKGVTIKNVLGMVSEIRGQVSVPLVLLLYYNCIFRYGLSKFVLDCKDAGVDGLIIPDLPLEESGELEETIAEATSKDSGVINIRLVSPDSGERLKNIVQNSKGFLYCVSTFGVTGERRDFNYKALKGFMDEVSSYTSLPKAIGFGISTPLQVSRLKDICDGVIVGSAIVKRIEESKNADEAVDKVGRFVRELSEALGINK